MEREALAALLCARACDYYRPGKPESDRCGGFERLKTLVETGRLGEGWPGHLGALPAGPLRHDPLLAAAVCCACAFRAADCDYRDPAGPPDAPPCGGLGALDHLLALGLLSPGDVAVGPR